MKQRFLPLLILVLYGLLACVLLYPLPRLLTTGLLEAQAGDPLMQIWVVQRNIHQLLSRSFAHYFDANIFYPYPNTFAYHDHMFGLGLLGLPIYALSQNPILTYNLLLLLSFVLSAYSMYFLVWELTHHQAAAFLAGMMFGFCPYRFAHLAHLNLLSIQWLPLCLLFLTRVLFSHVGTLSRKTSRRTFVNIAFFWGCFLLQALTSFNYLFMLAFIIGLFAILIIGMQWVLYRHALIRKRDVALLLVGGCLVGGLLLPFAMPYLHANQAMGFERTVQETQRLSARWQDYFVAPETNWLYGRFTRPYQSATSPFPQEQILFPGVLPIILSVIGVLGLESFARLFAKKRKRHGCSSSIALGQAAVLETHFILRISFVLVLLVAGLLSLGPVLTVRGHTLPLPYAAFYAYLPGFKSMRVPARFGLIVSFALFVLAGLGLAQVFDRLKRVKKIRKHLLTVPVVTGLLAGLLFLEYHSRPLAVTAYPGTRDTIPAVYQWLAQQPKNLSIIELPVRSARDNFEYAYYSTFHWQWMVNGRSAFIPDGITQVFNMMQHFPAPDTIALLKALKIRYVIVHTDKFSEGFRPIESRDLQVVNTFGNDVVFEVPQYASGSVAPRLHLESQMPLTLRPGERYTLGLTVRPTASVAFSPLPIERIPFHFVWKTKTQTVHQESRTLALPILLKPDEPISLPVSFTTPSILDDYQLEFQIDSSLVTSAITTKRVTLLPDVLDSRQPGKLQAQYFEIEIPDVWECGKPLPVSVVVRNTGDTLWLASVPERAHPVGEVHLGVVAWYDAATGVPLPQQEALQRSRGFLRYDLAPGQESVITTEIRTPATPGNYRLELDLVSELVQWFAARGSPPIQKTIHLK